MGFEENRFQELEFKKLHKQICCRNIYNVEISISV